MKRLTTVAAFVLAMSLISVNMTNVSASNYACTNYRTASVSSETSGYHLSQPVIAGVENVPDKANTFTLYWTDTGASGYDLIISDTYDRNSAKTYNISSSRSVLLDVKVPIYEEKRIYNGDGTYYYLNEIASYNTYRNTSCRCAEITLPDGLNFIWVRPYMKRNGRKFCCETSDFYLLECWNKTSDTTGFTGSEIRTDDYCPDDKTTKNESNVQQEVFDLINTERAKVGNSPLTLDPDLCRAAQIRADEISGYFSHTRPDGRDCFSVLEDLGVSHGFLGENIAMGQSTPSAVMKSWMNSSGHKANILNSSFTRVGIGYDAQSNSWVQLFSN